MTDRLSDGELDFLFGRFAAKPDRHPRIFSALVELRERRAEVKRLKAALRSVTFYAEGSDLPQTVSHIVVAPEHRDTVRSAHEGDKS